MFETLTVKLNNGLSMPVVGIGCWMGASGIDAVMVKKALEMGYRHIDTVGNEESVGMAIRESGVPREEIFITTKLNLQDHGRVSDALDDSLKKLGLDYIDLYLMHWPQAIKNDKVIPPSESPTILETWRDMEKLVDSGRAKSIGVSNFSEKTLGPLLEQARILPVTNQVEMHPLLPQHELLAYHKARNIVITAYAPVAKNLFSDDPDLLRVAAAHGISGPQVMLSWGIQRGTVVIPKTSREERVKENISLVTLTDEEMSIIDKLHEKPGMHRSACGFHAADGTVFGWTYEQLGWNMTTGGFVPQ
ncbi:Aldo/keto reductase [Mycena floridula]|nr:Aldo/keto reductase [Mycena floridula]